jgi:hypothetical protein
MGLSASFCSGGSLLSRCQSDPQIRRKSQKIYVMTDCMSSVTVPDGKGGFFADYTKEAEAALRRFADAGMNLVKSTDPLATWLR